MCIFKNLFRALCYVTDLDDIEIF